MALELSEFKEENWSYRLEENICLSKTKLNLLNSISDCMMEFISLAETNHIDTKPATKFCDWIAGKILELETELEILRNDLSSNQEIQND